MTLFALSNLVYLSALLNNRPCKIWKPIEISMLHKGNFERSHVANPAFKAQWGYFYIISIMISFNHPNPKAENKIISAAKNIETIINRPKMPAEPINIETRAPLHGLPYCFSFSTFSTFQIYKSHNRKLLPERETVYLSNIQTIFRPAPSFCRSLSPIYTLSLAVAVRLGGQERSASISHYMSPVFTSLVWSEAVSWVTLHTSLLLLFLFCIRYYWKSQYCLLQNAKLSNSINILVDISYRKWVLIEIHGSLADLLGASVCSDEVQWLNGSELTRKKYCWKRGEYDSPRIMSDDVLRRVIRGGGCRLCLAPDSECVPIFTTAAADKEPLSTKILSCVSIKVSEINIFIKRI